ncbi:hypothetical protein B0H14DRAFT_3884623 [Mycena olivaceomarginata]|nr:hypothetical protein B0H14DRAFT_3884623 [Mycena olivaceomarginata]
MAGVTPSASSRCAVGVELTAHVTGQHVFIETKLALILYFLDSLDIRPIFVNGD